MLRVHGLACPWNIYNSYNELMRPGAFKRFIAARNRKPLPMRLLHEDVVGEWKELVEGSDGLYASGVIRDPAAAYGYELGEFPELSIAWRFHDENLSKDLRVSKLRLNSKSAWDRAVYEEMNVPVVNRLEVDEAVIGEISLVDHGAFDGTWTQRSVR